MPGTSCCTVKRRRSGRTRAMSAPRGRPWSLVPISSGGHAQGAERRRASSHRRKHQPDHRQGAGPGQASIPRAHAPERRHQDPLSGSCEKPLAAVRPWQPVPRITKADGMRRTLPEIRGCLLWHCDRKIGPYLQNQSPIDPTSAQPRREIRLSEGGFIAFGSFQHWGPEQGVELACE